MAHSGAGNEGRPDGGWRLRRVAGFGRRVGGALVGAALPAAAAVLVVGVVRGAVADPVGWVRQAMATPLVGASGLPWAFHVAAVTAFAGGWILGLALVVEGYLGPD